MTSDARNTRFRKYASILTYLLCGFNKIFHNWKIDRVGSAMAALTYSSVRLILNRVIKTLDGQNELDFKKWKK